MNEETKTAVCFLLSDRLACRQRLREMRLVRERFPESGISCRIVSVPEDPDMDSRTERIAEFRKGELVVTDSGAVLRGLRRAGVPAAGYLHEGNRGENFSGAACLLEEPQEVDADSYLKIRQRMTGEPWTIAVTPRLWIREMTLSDLDDIYDLYDDPETVRFLEPPSGDRRKEEKILRAYIEKVYGLYGYGMWAICARGDGTDAPSVPAGEEVTDWKASGSLSRGCGAGAGLIGRIGFEPYQSGRDAVEMGFLIRRDVRRRGLATEAAGAVLRFADRYLDFPAVCARTHSDNTASMALLKRLGFRETGMVDGEAECGIRYFERRSR